MATSDEVAIDYDELIVRLNQLHDDRRTARLNRLYYQELLNRSQSLNRRFDVFTALANSAAIGSWVLWSTSSGKIAWAIVGAVATLVGIIKPFFKLPEEIEMYAGLYSGFYGVEAEYGAILNEAKATRGLTAARIARLADLGAHMAALGAKDTRSVNKKLQVQFTNQVNVDLPPEKLWMPVKPT